MTDRNRYTRRRLLGAVGTGVLGALAGCGSGGSPETTATDDPAPSTTDPTATARTTATPTPGNAAETTAAGGSASVGTGTLPSGSLPSYASLLPATGEPLVFTAYDPDQDPQFKLGGTPDDPTDPLRFDAVVGAVGARAAASFLLSLQLDFGVDRLGIDDTTRVLTVGGVGVQVMPVDLQGALSDVEGSDTRIERRGSDSAILVGPEGNVYGLTEDAFVFAPAEGQSGSVERVGAILDTRIGAATPRHESDPRFRSLLERGDTGGSVSCVHAPNGDAAAAVDAAATDRSVSAPALLTAGFASATGGLFHIDLDGETPRPASATLLYPDAGAIDDDALTTSVGTAATDRSYVRDGAAVRVEGTYPWEALRGFESDLGGVG